MRLFHPSWHIDAKGASVMPILELSKNKTALLSAMKNQGKVSKN